MPRDHTQFDLIVFGATGFVGKLVCRHLLDHAKVKEELSWAVAGRSRQKLDGLISDLGQGATELPCIIADATDENSLKAMCKQTRVVISTVGPYALYGDTLVKVCAENGIDYCDLTGEPQWIHRMMKQHETVARDSGARIVHCCGFDSIPSDLGVYYLQQKAREMFGTSCTQVSMRVMATKGGVSGGTVASIVNLVKEAAGDSILRRAMKDPYWLSPHSKKARKQSSTMISVKFDEDFQRWVAPFVMAEVNTRVVLLSNTLQEYAYGENFCYEEGVLTRRGIIGWSYAQGIRLGMLGFILAAALPPTRWLLKKTILPAPGNGPSPEKQEKGFYDLRFMGRTDQGDKLQVRVTGNRDPGYGSTSMILGQTGICLAKDDTIRRQAGGFWTPAALCGDTLLHRLQKHAQLTFETIP